MEITYHGNGEYKIQDEEFVMWCGKDFVEDFQKSIEQDFGHKLEIKDVTKKP